MELMFTFYEMWRYETVVLSMSNTAWLLAKLRVWVWVCHVCLPTDIQASKNAALGHTQRLISPLETIQWRRRLLMSRLQRCYDDKNKTSSKSLVLMHHVKIQLKHISSLYLLLLYEQNKHHNFLLVNAACCVTFQLLIFLDSTWILVFASYRLKRKNPHSSKTSRFSLFFFKTCVGSLLPLCWLPKTEINISKNVLIWLVDISATLL